MIIAYSVPEETSWLSSAAATATAAAASSSSSASNGWFCDFRCSRLPIRCGKRLNGNRQSATSRALMPPLPLSSTPVHPRTISQISVRNYENLPTFLLLRTVSSKLASHAQLAQQLARFLLQCLNPCEIPD